MSRCGSWTGIQRGSQPIDTVAPALRRRVLPLPPSPLPKEQVLAPPVTFKFFHSVGGFFLGPSQGDVRTHPSQNQWLHTRRQRRRFVPQLGLVRI